MNPLNLYAISIPGGTIFVVATSLADALTMVPSGTIATAINAVASVGYATPAAISALQAPTTSLATALSAPATANTAMPATANTATSAL